MLSLPYFTLLHVLISLTGIFSGFGVLSGLLGARLFPRWTALFLASTVATSVTGFFFPFRGVTPAVAVGVISLLVLTMAIYALYVRSLTGPWRSVYVINAMIALYLNVFVLVAQLFQKMPVLKALAPKQTEPPFAITQGIVFALFIVLGLAATKRFVGVQLAPRRYE